MEIRSSKQDETTKQSLKKTKNLKISWVLKIKSKNGIKCFKYYML